MSAKIQPHAILPPIALTQGDLIYATPAPLAFIK